MNNSFGCWRSGFKVGSKEVELGEGEDEGYVLDEDGVAVLVCRSHKDEETVDVVYLVRPFHCDAFLALNGFALSLYLRVRHCLLSQKVSLQDIVLSGINSGALSMSHLFCK